MIKWNIAIVLCIIAAMANAAELLPFSAEPSIFGDVTQWGLAGAIILFTLWRDWQREGRMSLKNHELEEYIRTEMRQVVEANTKALHEVTDIIRKCRHT